MNDQQLLGDLGSLLDPPGAELPADLRRRVVTSVQADAASSRWTWGWKPVAAVGTLVAALAVVVAVPVIGVGGHAPEASAEAAEVLHQAARVAAQDPGAVPRADQFVFIESQTWYPVTGSSSPGSSVTRSWKSVDGTHDGLVRTDTGAQGKPHETVLPGCRDGRMAEWAGNGALSADATQPCQPASAYVQNLPTTADGMLAYLGQPGRDGTQMFARAGELVQQGYLPPKVRAALFDAVARIPGVGVIDQVTDSAGRKVTAVALGAGAEQLLFDPATDQFQGWQSAPAAGGTQVALPQLRREALLRVSVVDKPGDLPK
jgi:hypothetical protein